MDDKSLTDKIYQELVDGLKTGLDWTHFLAKYGGSKGPLYSAFGRFSRDMEPKVRALNEVQAKLDTAGLKLDSLDQKINEAQSGLAPLEERKNSLNDQIETLETKVAEKRELLEHAGELGKLGFNTEMLRQLRQALLEIGVKQGLKGKEAVSKFFDELRDYDAKTGFEQEIQRLETITETKRLEAEKWQAKEEEASRKHDNLREAISAVHAFLGKGFKVSQIVAWNQVLKRFETVEQFAEYLAQYAEAIKLVNARKEEAEAYELRLTKAQSQLETVEAERLKIEASIDALKVAGVNQLKDMTEAIQKQQKAAAAAQIRETQAVAQEISAQLDKQFEKVFQLGQKYEELRQKLQPYEVVRDTLQAVASEAEK